ncbi:hypothetical protein B0T18DRAFT_246513 [Schizothecium vesticola]|uniref:Uncharacterized protein n=1 Tax=Schizothecium vesticola TaxID=314040 RepID=A0AA40BQJ3_9PEZI|nr:hypothetical protein B0T18DRAFT_246513 [Schizothecium vesticola]
MSREAGSWWMAVGHGLGGSCTGGGGGRIVSRPQCRDAEFILKEWAMRPCTWRFFLLPETQCQSHHTVAWWAVGATCTGECRWKPLPPEHTTTYMAWTQGKGDGCWGPLSSIFHRSRFGVLLIYTPGHVHDETWKKRCGHLWRRQTPVGQCENGRWRDGRVHLCSSLPHPQRPANLEFRSANPTHINNQSDLNGLQAQTKSHTTASPRAVPK